MDFNDFLWLIILTFTCYRLAQLIADDDGPLSVFGRLRQWVDAKAKEEQDRGKLLLWQSAADGIHCPYCVGVWVAIVLAVVWSGITPVTLVYILAIAGGQSWLQSRSK